MKELSAWYTEKQSYFVTITVTDWETVCQHALLVPFRSLKGKLPPIMKQQFSRTDRTPMTRTENLTTIHQPRIAPEYITDAREV
jgi:hypothetical protein